MLVHDVDSLNALFGWSIDCGSKSELQFCFSCTVELLVDGSVIAVKLNIGSSGIGESFELDISVRRDRKKDSKLDQCQHLQY